MDNFEEFTEKVKKIVDDRVQALEDTINAQCKQIELLASALNSLKSSLDNKKTGKIRAVNGRKEEKKDERAKGKEMGNNKNPKNDGKKRIVVEALSIGSNPLDEGHGNADEQSEKINSDGLKGKDQEREGIAQDV